MTKEQMHRLHEYCTGSRRAVRIMMMVFIGITAAAGFALLFGIVVKSLWNWLMPSIFGLKEITYWQAFGLTMLGKILFSGINHNHSVPKIDRMDLNARRMSMYADRLDDRCDSRGAFSRFSHEDMRHYRDFWREKGETAFEEYLRSKKGDDASSAPPRES